MNISAVGSSSGNHEDQPLYAKSRDRAPQSTVGWSGGFLLSDKQLPSEWRQLHFSPPETQGTHLP